MLRGAESFSVQLTKYNKYYWGCHGGRDLQISVVVTVRDGATSDGAVSMSARE